jgi:hypothetical protein
MIMNSRSRISLLAVCFLSFLALPGLTRDAHAIAIDNDVVIDWQNGRYLEEAATVLGKNFVASVDSLDEIFVGILVTEAAGDLQGFELIMSVGNSLAELEADPNPLQLTLRRGVNLFGGDFDPPADPYIPNGTSYELTVALSDFQGFALLPTNVSTLAFSLGGSFFAGINAGAGLPACSERPAGEVCPAWPGQVSVTVTSKPPATVPEPGSLSLLLLGITGAVGLRRRRS